jgi:transcriptional regulator with XRE-family HTH domain
MVPLTPARLRKIREQLSLSQERMARLLGVSFVSVNRWEHEGSTGPLGVTQDIYRALDVALRSGADPQRVLAADTGDRGHFLYRVFSLAYGGKKGAA